MALFGRETAQDRERERAWREWFGRQHPFALASLVLSVFSLTHFGTLFVDELAAIVLGVLAIRAARRGDRRGSGVAYVGVIVALISLGCAIFIYFVLDRGR
jgi:hypothetical protein